MSDHPVFHGERSDLLATVDFTATVEDFAALSEGETAEVVVDHTSAGVFSDRPLPCFDAVTGATFTLRLDGLSGSGFTAVATRTGDTMIGDDLVCTGDRRGMLA